MLARGHGAVGLHLQIGILLPHHADADVDAELGAIVFHQHLADADGRGDQVIDRLERIAQVLGRAEERRPSAEPALDAAVEGQAVARQRLFRLASHQEAVALEDDEAAGVTLELVGGVHGRGVAVALRQREAGAGGANPARAAGAAASGRMRWWVPRRGRRRSTGTPGEYASAWFSPMQRVIQIRDQGSGQLPWHTARDWSRP